MKFSLLWFKPLKVRSVLGQQPPLPLALHLFIDTWNWLKWKTPFPFTQQKVKI